MRSPGDARDRERPVALGYLVGTMTEAEVAQATAEFVEFAHREGYALGTVFVERTAAPAAFAALLEEASRTGAPVVVVRGPRMLPCAAHETQLRQQP